MFYVALFLLLAASSFTSSSALELPETGSNAAGGQDRGILPVQVTTPPADQIVGAFWFKSKVKVPWNGRFGSWTDHFFVVVRLSNNWFISLEIDRKGNVFPQISTKLPDLKFTYRCKPRHQVKGVDSAAGTKTDAQLFDWVKNNGARFNIKQFRDNNFAMDLFNYLTRP
jgi:hypothetical protein